MRETVIQYKCVKCGSPATPDMGTKFDERYTLGRCLAEGRSCGRRVNLVRADLYRPLEYGPKPRMAVSGATEDPSSSHRINHRSYVDGCRHCERERLVGKA